MVLEDEPPRSEDTPTATGEEAPLLGAADSNDGDGSNLNRSSSLDVIRNAKRRVRFTNKHSIATWNVRSMSSGKMEIVLSEMERTTITTMGISELKWIGKGHFRTGKHMVYYSGHESLRKNGGQPIKLTIIQIYAPTTDADEEDIEDFYHTLEEVLDNTPKI
ncbi:craniofacial development protein 2-like [Penaeus indicus]|uniref:craniofacial development protein 2-like n=1 Tax=Penaeus indicus TaxID=29960 RepID=UPI00300CC009